MQEVLQHLDVVVGIAQDMVELVLKMVGSCLLVLGSEQGHDGSTRQVSMSKIHRPCAVVD